MQRNGVSEAPVVCMFTTIQNLSHYIRTIFGDFKLNFGGDMWTVPLQGVGQGNGAGPQIWAIISTPVLNMMREEGFDAFFKASISGDELGFVGYAFVDDTDLCETAGTGHATGPAVALQMQRSLDHWEGGFRATGGAIAPEKSHWYLIDFCWHHGSWRYASEEQSPGSLTVLDSSGQRQTLERLPPDSARRTLGVRLAPDGNNHAEVTYLHSCASEWKERIRTGHLPRQLAWQALTTTILPKLHYPLAANTMTEKECNFIMSPVLQGGLSCSGIVRTLPHTLVYGTTKYQGLGIPSLYTEQGIAHILKLLQHGHQPSITGDLLWASLQALQVELGISGFPLEQHFPRVGFLATDHCWVKHAWKFMSSSGFTIQSSALDPSLKLRRGNDSFLMELFL